MPTRPALKEKKLSYRENEIWCKRCRAPHRATGPSKGHGAKGAQNIASGAAAQSASLAVRSGSPKRLMVATCDGDGQVCVGPRDDLLSLFGGASSEVNVAVS